MKNNRKIWGFVFFVLLTTAGAFVLTGIDTHSQKLPEGGRFRDRSKYSVVNFDEIGPSDLKARDEKKRKDKRYDKMPMVLGNAQPGIDMALAYDAEPVPAAIPADSSSLVIVGRIASSRAIISDDKGAVYTEFSIRIQSVLKAGGKEDVTQGTVTADRRGGIVRYPNGQDMLYMIDWMDMPQLGQAYLLFLSRENDESPNYKLVTGYQLNNGRVMALDNHKRFRKFDKALESDFITEVQAAIKQGGP